ncbi:MAG: putative membrane protein YfcA, partial [Acidimicrobiales bacterium]
SDHLEMIIVGVVGVMIGSWIGTRLLDRASEAGLDLLFKVVLTALATRIIFTALT